MRITGPVVGCVVALILLIDAQSGQTLRADAQLQLREPVRTVEGSSAGGWAGPCEDWWDTSEFQYNARRVCRVAASLIGSFRKAGSPIEAERFANEGFRVCWGVFPKAGNDCNGPNAWARAAGWIRWARAGGPGGTPPPIVVTLAATEMVQSDDEMAFLLSHEMGHALDSEQTTQANSRENEYRADVGAIGFLVNAGYDARSAGRSLQNLVGERGRTPLGNLLGILSNHLGQAASQDVHGFTFERIDRMRSAFVKGCAALNNRPLGCKAGWN